MDDPEIISLIERVLQHDCSDEEFGILIERLKVETKCPNFLNLIKHSSLSESGKEILKKAREYRPIQL